MKRADDVMSGSPGQSTPSQEQHFAVDVVTQSGLWAQGGIAHEPLARAARVAYAAAGGRDAAAVALALSDDAQVRELNREWRGMDKATDVLSFPDGEMDGEICALGDIILAYETVARDAEEAGLQTGNHAIHLVIHGMLHLLGYDHDTEDDAAAMERLETDIMAGLGLHDPYGLLAETQA
jgi:probable rRNA maturation factor